MIIWLKSVLVDRSQLNHQMRTLQLQQSQCLFFFRLFMFMCEKFTMVFSCFVPLLTLFEINCLSFADTDTRARQAQNRQQV